MARELGQPLFTFAALSDSHVNEEEGHSTSPYASNRHANARLRRVVAAIGRQRPAFVVHLGDMGNPLPELASYPRAAARFHDIVRPLGAPLHLVPGNHCVGDKPTGWVPVPRISRAALALFEEQYGRQCFSFDHGPCHFAVLNSLLVNSGLAAADEQRRWLERDLAVAAGDGRRLWLLMHYPAFVATPEEPGSYDNLDEPGRAWLLELVARHRIEAALSGHVHNWFVNRFAGTDLYTLPATSFVRQDYSELYSVAPEDAEGGRDDRAKLGWCLVHVHERGHVVQLVRSYGARLAADEPDEVAAGPPAEPSGESPDGSSQTPAEGAAEGSETLSFPGAETPLPLAVEMRENWLELRALRPNNSVSPFTRRLARADWAVAALAEMGVVRVRLALQELAAVGVPARLEALAERGFRFTVYSNGVPTAGQRALVESYSELLAGWELILPLDRLEEAAAALAGFVLPLFLSELRDVDRTQIDDANVKHEANYGFQAHEPEKIQRLCAAGPAHGLFAGLVFRLRRRGAPVLSPWAAMREIGRLGEETGMRHQAHLLFSGSLTSERLVDDLATADRVAEAVLGAVAVGNVDLCCDTFEDTDRGYFVRHGLVDRRYNPRPAARVVRHLGAELGPLIRDGLSLTRREKLPDGRLVVLGAGERLAVAVLPRPRVDLGELTVAEWAGKETAAVVDLTSGSRSTLPLGAGGELRPDSTVEIDRPHLLLAAPA